MKGFLLYAILVCLMVDCAEAQVDEIDLDQTSSSQNGSSADTLLFECVSAHNDNRLEEVLSGMSVSERYDHLCKRCALTFSTSENGEVVDAGTGWTLVGAAASQEDWYAVRLLLEDLSQEQLFNIFCQKNREEGFTLVIYALKSRCFDKIKDFWHRLSPDQRSTVLSIKDNVDQSTALLFVAMGGCARYRDELRRRAVKDLFKGLDVSQQRERMCDKNDKGVTPLIGVTFNGTKQTAEELLAPYNADPDGKVARLQDEDCDGNTAILRAARNSNIGMVSLLRRGVDINKWFALLQHRNLAGETACYLATIGGNPDNFKNLVQGLTLSQKLSLCCDDTGRCVPPLFWAMAINDTEVFDNFLNGTLF